MKGKRIEKGDSDKERLMSVFNKVSVRGDLVDSTLGGLYEMVASLASKYGYKKSGFVQEMVVAGLLSTRMVREDFMTLLDGNTSENAPQLKILVDRVRGLLER